MLEKAVRMALISVPNRRLVLAAVSGGPDSVALLHALVRLRAAHPELGYRTAAAHLNHGLRGAESDQDEDFVRNLCSRLEVRLVVGRAPALGRARANLEERARNERYEFLNQAAENLGADLIAVAHQANDQSETVMLRLLRGSGASGLAAMAQTGPGRLFRPLLGVSRERVLAYLQAIHADYVTDTSNSSLDFQRNRVRTELLPMLEREYAPRFGRRLVELASEMSEMSDFLSTAANREIATRLRPDNRLDLAGFSDLQPALAAAVLRAFLRKSMGGLRHIRRVQIEAMRRVCMVPADSGSVVIGLPGGWTFRREYGLAGLHPGGCEPPGPFAVELRPEGCTVVEAAGFAFSARVIERGGTDALPPKAESKLEAYFDANAVGSLVVRSFVPGDRIRMFGKGGRRKVHDVFIDQKLPAALRPRWPLVISDGEVAWIPQWARSALAIVTPATQKVLCLRATPYENAV